MLVTQCWLPTHHQVSVNREDLGGVAEDAFDVFMAEDRPTSLCRSLQRFLEYLHITNTSWG